MQQKIDLMKKMSFSDNFSYTFRLFKEHFVYLIKTLAYFFVPAIIIITGIGILLWNRFIELFGMIEGDKFNSSNAMLIAEIFLYIFIFVFIFSIVSLYTNAVSVMAINEKLEGRDTSPKEVVGAVLKKTIPLLFTSILAGLMVGLGFFFCFIPGYILMIYIVFIPHAIMLEDKRYGQAIGRSFSFVNKNFWQIVLLLLVIYFLWSFVSGFVNLPFYVVYYIHLFSDLMKTGGEIDPGNMTSFFNRFGVVAIIIFVINIILMMLYTSLLNISLTLKFLNIRNIREGTDLLNKIAAEKNVGEKNVIE